MCYSTTRKLKGARGQSENDWIIVAICSISVNYIKRRPMSIKAANFLRLIPTTQSLYSSIVFFFFFQSKYVILLTNQIAKKIIEVHRQEIRNYFWEGGYFKIFYYTTNNCFIFHACKNHLTTQNLSIYVSNRRNGPQSCSLLFFARTYRYPDFRWDEWSIQRSTLQGRVTVFWWHYLFSRRKTTTESVPFPRSTAINSV